MTLRQLRPAPLATGTGLGSGICSAALSTSENTALALGGQGIIDLQAWRLQRRFGISDSVARVISSHAYGLSLEGHRG